MKSLLVDAQGVQAWYGSSHILRGVDLQLAEGESLGLLGRKVERLYLDNAAFRAAYAGAKSHAEQVITAIGIAATEAQIDRWLDDPALAEEWAASEHAADVAHDGFGGHRTEGRNLAHGIGAVFFSYVFNHAPAVFLAEVDIKVGH